MIIIRNQRSLAYRGLCGVSSPSQGRGSWRRRRPCGWSSALQAACHPLARIPLCDPGHQGPVVDVVPGLRGSSVLRGVDGGRCPVRLWSAPGTPVVTGRRSATPRRPPTSSISFIHLVLSSLFLVSNPALFVFTLAWTPLPRQRMRVSHAPSDQSHARHEGAVGGRRRVFQRHEGRFLNDAFFFLL